MEIIDLPIDSIIPAPWNPNEMDPEMLSRLRHSIQRFALVVPLVVRLVGNDVYETIGGAQRLSILRELAVESVSCVLVQANDGEARLLGQAMNHIALIGCRLILGVYVIHPKRTVIRIAIVARGSLSRSADMQIVGTRREVQ